MTLMGWRLDLLKETARQRYEMGKQEAEELKKKQRKWFKKKEKK